MNREAWIVLALFGAMSLTAVCGILSTSVDSSEKSQLERRVDLLEKQVNGISIGVWGKPAAEMKLQDWKAKTPESYQPFKLNQAVYLTQFESVRHDSQKFAKFVNSLKSGTVKNWSGRFHAIAETKLSNGDGLIYLRMGDHEDDSQNVMASCSFSGNDERFYSIKPGTKVTIKSGVFESASSLCLIFKNCVFDK